MPNFESPFQFEGPRALTPASIEDETQQDLPGGGESDLEAEEYLTAKRNLLSMLRVDPSEVDYILEESPFSHQLISDPDIRREVYEAISRLFRDKRNTHAIVLSKTFEILPSQLRKIASEYQVDISEPGIGLVPEYIIQSLDDLIWRADFSRARKLGEKSGLTPEEMSQLFSRRIHGFLFAKRFPQLEEGLKFFPQPEEVWQVPELRKYALESVSIPQYKLLDRYFHFSTSECEGVIQEQFRQAAQSGRQSFLNFLESIKSNIGGKLPTQIEEIRTWFEAEVENHRLLPDCRIQDVLMVWETERMGKEEYFKKKMESIEAADEMENLLKLARFLHLDQSVILQPVLRKHWLRILVLAIDVFDIRQNFQHFALLQSFLWQMDPSGEFYRGLFAEPELLHHCGAKLVEWSGYNAHVRREDGEATLGELFDPNRANSEMPSFYGDIKGKLAVVLEERSELERRYVSRALILYTRQSSVQEQLEVFLQLDLDPAEKESWKRDLLKQLPDLGARMGTETQKFEQMISESLPVIGVDPKTILAQWHWMQSPEIEKRIRESVEFKKFGFVLSREALLARKTHQISPLMYAVLEEMHPRVLEKDGQGRVDGEKIMGAIERVTNDILIAGQEEETDLAVMGDGKEVILTPDIHVRLEVAIDRFGKSVMARYLNRPDLSYHDALHFFDHIYPLMNGWEISPAQFAANILDQVAKDSSSYPAGTAHHHFGTVMQLISGADLMDFTNTLEQYLNVFPSEQLQGYLDRIRENPAYFVSSWKNLKKFSEIQQLVRQKEVLQKLGSESNPNMRSYIGKLIFHPNISSDAVKSLYGAPEDFFGTPDLHAELTIAPLDWCNVPHLGLTPENLRDALIGRSSEQESTLDRLQLIPPFQGEYRIGMDPFDLSDPVVLHRTLLVDAIGKLREKKPGKARNPKKLLTETQRLLGLVKSDRVFPPDQFPEKDSSKRFSAFAKPETGVEILNRLRYADPSTHAAIQQLVVHPEFGMTIEDTRPLYRVTVWKKSDPNGAVAGNDTASCMPFGAGKKIHYDMSPGCSQMTVERLVVESGERKWRTVAQSELTLDREMQISFQEMRNMTASVQVDMEKMGSMDVLDGKLILMADNIEIAKNELGSRTGDLKSIYQRFARDYLNKHAQTMGADPTRLLVGEGYSPEDLNFARVSNKFIPAIVTSYTDNLTDTTFSIPTGLDAVDPKRPIGISDLRPTDVFAVAGIEQKAYAEIPHMIEGLIPIQQKIQAQCVAAEFRGISNLSFIYRDRSGIPKGYVIAYEGRYRSEQGENRYVYIADMASDPTAQIVSGARLTQAFMERFFEAYVKEGEVPIPIFTHARESTSLKVIQNQAEKRALQRGLVAVVEDSLGEEVGDPNTFHDVWIGFGRTQEEAQMQIEHIRRKASLEVHYASSQSDYSSAEEWNNPGDIPNDNWDDAAE